MKNKMKHLTRLTLSAALLLLLFQACKMPEMKEPKFEQDPDQLIAELKELSDFENADIRWSARNFKDTTTYYLVVNLIKGEDLPEDDAGLEKLGKKAMKLVVNSVENKSDFDIFRVVFGKVKKSGVVTRSSKNPFEYSLSDLSGED